MTYKVIGDTTMVKYYNTIEEARRYRRKGDIIYYDANKKAYYIKKKPKSFWEEFFGL